jgi:hypothetical protein
MDSNSKKSDLFGIISSLLCILHCILLPFLVLGGMMAEEWVAHSQWMDVIFIALAFVAVYLTTRRMQNRLIRNAMWFCILWFSVSVLLHHHTHLALYSSLLASGSLVVLHSINFRRHHSLRPIRKMA